MPMDIACSEIARVRAVWREGTCRWEMKSTVLGTISPSFSLFSSLCLPPNEVDESFLFRVSGLLPLAATHLTGMIQVTYPSPVGELLEVQPADIYGRAKYSSALSHDLHELSFVSGRWDQ